MIAGIYRKTFTCSVTPPLSDPSTKGEMILDNGDLGSDGGMKLVYSCLIFPPLAGGIKGRGKISLIYQMRSL